MAYYVSSAHVLHVIPPEKAATMWKVLIGELEPENEAQKEFMNNVADVYMNPQNPITPASYIQQRGHLLTQGKQRLSAFGGGEL